MEFAPYLGWVDVPDPANPPAGAKKIMAADLLRYEHGISAAKTPTDPPNPNVEAANLYSYGHSYSIVPSPYTTPNAGEYPLRMGKRLSMPVIPRGRSGTFLTQTFGCMLGTTFGGDTPDRTWVPGSRGVVLLHNMMNESSFSHSEPFLSEWKQSLRGALALVSSKQKVEFAQATLTGTWSAYTNAATAPSFSAGDVRFTNVIGSTVEFPITGDEAWLVVGNSTSTYSTSKLDILINGVFKEQITTQGKLAVYKDSVIPGDTFLSPAAYKVSGLDALAGAGDKKLTVRVAENKNAFVNCVIIPGARKPAVFVAKEPPRNPPAGGAIFDSHEPFYRAAIDEVCAEFGNAHIVDLKPGWDNSTMVSSLDVTHNFHPNDLGMQHIARTFIDAINDVVVAPDPGVITL